MMNAKRTFLGCCTNLCHATDNQKLLHTRQLSASS
jgi:hypothetical protein